MKSMLHTLAAVMILTALVGCSLDRKDKDKTDSEQTQKGETPPSPISFADLPVDLGAVENLTSILRKHGTDKLHAAGFRGQNLKIAVFDNGFTGLNHSKGKRLPPDVEVMPAPGNGPADTTHGTKMAEIVYAVATGSVAWSKETNGPKILLYNTNGFTNLKAAVDDAIGRDVDMILYAQVWEYGDNNGTDGFINDVIRRATDRGILWINASGNFAETTYRSTLKFAEDGSVELPFDGKYLRLHITAPRSPVRIVLSWSDFDNSPNYKTPQNLDLRLLDRDKKEIAISNREQNGGRDDTHSLFSAHAREIIMTELEAGTYYLAIDAKTRNFDEDARISVAVDGLAVSLPEATVGDSLMAPAGNPSVLAVGALDSSKTSLLFQNGRITKPEIFIASEIAFTDGVVQKGTSAASAIAAGALAAWISANGTLPVSQIRDAFYNGELAEQRVYCMPHAHGCYHVHALRMRK